MFQTIGSFPGDDLIEGNDGCNFEIISDIEAETISDEDIDSDDSSNCGKDVIETCMFQILSVTCPLIQVLNSIFYILKT